MKIQLLIALLLTSKLAGAQSSVSLNPVSVTTNRVAQNANETGRNITVIEGKDFQQLPVNSLDELLKYVPGVEVQSRGPMGAQSDIVLRGGTYQQVLILLDGIKVNDPITGHFSSYIPIAPYEIHHIEILRGPAAAVYGAEAVGGVIHVVSKTFGNYNDSTAQNGHIKATIGQYNFVAADAGLSFTGKRANASIGVLSNNTSGQLLRGNNRGYLYNQTFSGSVSINLCRNWKLSLRSSYDQRDFAAQNFYTTFKSDTATEKVNTLWQQAQLIKKTKKGSHQIDAVYKNTSDHYLYNEASTANDNKSAFAMAQYIQQYRVSSKVLLSGGTQLSQRSIISNDRGNHKTGQAAVFGTGLYRHNHWNISSSLRADYDGNYGLALLPQANIAYVLQYISFRANAGRATRSADFTERYNNYNKSMLKGGSIGNPNLSAEKSWSYEAGITTQPYKWLQVNATVFARNQSDVIDWANTQYADMPRKENLDTSGVFALAQNINKVNTQGLEIDFTFRKKLDKNQQLFINMGATFMRSSSNDPNPSYYIIAHARSLFQTTIIYSYDRLSLSANFLYKDRNPSVANAINANLGSSYF
ncbi:MAG: TonB-dependent receptor, partial [Chitinophagaceae bacterium]|nr:TonB-dependent receptor [Chitinophagaceae bacterium]